MSNKSEAPFDKVRGGKLLFKGGLGPNKSIQKKKKKGKKNSQAEGQQGAEGPGEDTGLGTEAGVEKEVEERDTGIGFAPDGRKKTAKYEEMFPFETRRFGYVAPTEVKTREDALDAREKKKADRYCK